MYLSSMRVVRAVLRKTRQRRLFQTSVALKRQDVKGVKALQRIRNLSTRSDDALEVPITESVNEPYEEWKEDGFPQHGDLPQYGILSKLHGTWVNWKEPGPNGAFGPTGMHTTIMPSPGSTSETIFGVFHFKAQEYTEQFKFTQVNEPVRNRAGSNEQFNGPVMYEQRIVDMENVLQHFENGMFLWLGDSKQPWTTSEYKCPPTMLSHAADCASIEEDNAAPILKPGDLGPMFVPPHSISRSGVIPHGTTMHLTGKITDSNDCGEPPLISELWDKRYLSVDETMGFFVDQDLKPYSPTQNVKPSWADVAPEYQLPDGINSGRAYCQKILNYDQFGAQFPYTLQPNLKLSNFNETLTFNKWDLIELDTFHDTGVQGAAVNNVMIERYCRVSRVRFRMWLEEVRDEVDGPIIDQLQYEQIVDFEFQFSSTGGTTLWPHIQVNTLRRVEDVESAGKVPTLINLETPPDDLEGRPKANVYRMRHTRV